MLSVEEAHGLVLDRCHALPPSRVDLMDALGRVLAEDVAADRDSPPFDKSVVDGYAVRSADLDAGANRELRVLEEVAAGQVPRRPVGPFETSMIMTGAPIPTGADAVVMLERVERIADLVRIDSRECVAAGTNLLRRGAEMTSGQTVLESGRVLRSVELGVLATVGNARPLVSAKPLVGVISTGDELVGMGDEPGPGQIRDSNGVLLSSLVAGAGAAARLYPRVGDDADRLRATIGAAIGECDVVLMTGGVSAGKRDFVPGVLEALGVERVFHKIRLRPGKPLWFGVGPKRSAESDGRPAGALVFGLPGNPVSALVCFRLFVAPALARLAGRPGDAALVADCGRLACEFEHRGDRATYHPARVEASGDSASPIPSVLPLAWRGSADLRALVDANALAVFAPGGRTYAQGEPVNWIWLESRAANR
jgi:molybdopterin molybdotransferase